MAVPSRFELVTELGAGGMGTVYEAVDRELGVRVALKVLHEAGGEAIEKLKHEFRVAADVHHENLVRLGELFEHAQRWCFSMELVDGVDLIAYVARRRAAPGKATREVATTPTTPIGSAVRGSSDERRWDGEMPPAADFDDAKLRAAFAQLADGLAALHAAGIVHRDLKPSNIRVRPDGRVVLLDLGLAAFEADLREVTNLAGTLEYMAPEQVRGGEIDTAADVYAMGALLYEALVGRPPHVGPVAQILAEKAAFDPLPPAVLFPEVPAELDRLCMALLARDPRRRPSAAAVAAALRETEAPVAAGALRTARGFVGREVELASLREVRAGAVHVVAGPSGIGKSRLLGRFAQALRDHASLVCVGRCRVREHVRLNAWEPLLDGLTRMLSGLPRAQSNAMLPGDAEAISRLFPIFARVLPVATTSSLPAAELERRALLAIRELLRRVARGGPVVLVIDDVQWATRDSLTLLTRLLAPPSAPPLALVLGLRSGAEIEAVEAWLREVEGLGIAVARTELGPLREVEARELAHLLVDDGERADRLAAETGGHPLFLEMMASAAAGGDALHVTLRERVDGLPAALRDLLGVLVASGAPLRLDLLGAAVGRDVFAIADALRGLVQQRMVTVTGMRRADHAEPFHAQVAEAVIAATPPEGLRADHGRIATALEMMPHVRPERRALHWAWAGEPARAAAAALELVASARHALAYSRAADVCALVLQLDVPADVRAALERAHADALAGAGEALRAAVAYRSAAASAAGDARLDLERRAAENFLRCAAIDDGMELFDRVAGALGYRRGGSPAATIAALLVERARLRVRGTSFRRAAAVDAALAARSDACYSLSTGLAMLDAISGALFQTRSTRLALDCGDPARAARALAIEACFVAAWGSRTRARAGRILEAAGVLANEVQGPMVKALVDIGRGICALQWGDFDDAVRYCDDAIAIFREHGAGVVWEERTGEVFATWALAWRGDWGEVGRRCDALARAGAATGDRYASMHAAVGPAVCGLLAIDDPAQARARVVEAMAGWRRDRMDLPQVRELVALSMIGLHEGRGADVLEALRARWRDLERSRMLDLEPVLGTLAELRARAALIAGDLADARTWTKRLARVPWAAGIATLFRAALLAADGSRAAALAELERAEAQCHASRVELYAAAARERRGLMIGDAALVESAHAAAREREIANPERVLRSVAPWPG